MAGATGVRADGAGRSAGTRLRRRARRRRRAAALGEAEIGVAGAGRGLRIGAVLLLVAQGQGFLLLRRQVALIIVGIVKFVAFLSVEAGRGGIVGAPDLPIVIPPDAAQPGGGFLGWKGHEPDRRGAKFTPFLTVENLRFLARAQREAGGDEEGHRGGGGEGGRGVFGDRIGRVGHGAVEHPGVVHMAGAGFGAGAGQVEAVGFVARRLFRADQVEKGDEILRDDAGERGVGPFGRGIRHAIQSGEHRHGEPVVVAVAGDFACVHVLADHFLMAGQRTGEQIVGEARAGDEDGRVPAEAKGRAVAADAQGIGGAGGDGGGFAGGADDAGRGEGFKEEALARGAPAVDADLLRGGGEGRELAGHGKALCVK